ncbi:MAG TPA: NAD(P)H-hydrate dehydratase [Polyangia bacterium]|nr:NAD(P)H-hydrate dehydratase [Polyangia bacterium]
MSYVLTAEQMRAVDRAASESFGVPTLLLMENAGRGVAEVVRAAVGGRLAGLRICVVCGAGSNGGDGFVVARHLALAGAEVQVVLAAARTKITGDAALMLAALEGMGGVPLADGAAWDGADARRWGEALAGAQVVVDALFGTGLRADVTGAAAAAITAMNAAPGIKIAVDLPSGIEADSGRVCGVAFRADVTATMGARKLGFTVDPEVAAGRVEVVSLGVPIRPPAALGPYCHFVDVGEVSQTLAGVPRRGPGGHKGTAGHLLVVAGSAGKTGAALLSARAAMRAGVGLCTIASTAAGHAALDAKVVEVMTARYSDGEDADAGSAGRLSALAGGMRALAIGPGIPTGPGMRSLIADLVGRSPLPMVIDADALNLMATDVGPLLAPAPAARVLTPHPGEMARLLGTTTAEVQRTRVASARRLATETRAVVVLKGARTLTALADGTVYINPTANPALGTAGAGDVLTGVIGALLAQGLAAPEAARLGVLVHGLAGERASAAVGGLGMVAGDLPDAIARVMGEGRSYARRSGSAAPGG